MRAEKGTSAYPSKYDRLGWLCVFSCCALLLVDRWLILEQFGYRYVDDDQAIMWNGAEEMSHGRFHEPCFYGQDYNTMLEGVLAVPMRWLDVAPNVALPTVTSMLTLFPFVLLASILSHRKAFVQAAFVLSVPVLLPPEFGMLTCMPLGMVTGVFLASAAVLPAYSGRRVFFVLAPFLAVLAIFANPNSVLLLLPLVILAIERHWRNRGFWWYGFVGAVPAYALIQWAQRFYSEHPNHVQHHAWELQYDLAQISWSCLRYLDEVSPLLWGKGWWVLVLFVTLALALGRFSEKRSMIALAAAVLLLVASFGVNKVHDGIPSVFYPWARMFIAVPFLLALFAARIAVPQSRWLLMALPLLSAGFFVHKCIVQADAVERQLNHQRATNKEVAEVADLHRQCVRIASVAHAQRAALVVTTWGPRKHLINYGCPCLVADFPHTLNPELDRRTWHLHDESEKQVSTVMFSGFDEGMLRIWRAKFPDMKCASENPYLIVLSGNTLRTDTLLRRMGMGIRPVD